MLYLFIFKIQGELASDYDVVDFIMNQPNVVPRINSRILTTTRSYLDLSSTSQFAFICFPKLICDLDNLCSVDDLAPGNAASFPVRH